MAVKYHERQHKNSDGTWETIREPIYYDGQGDKEQRLERGSLKNNPQIQSIDGKANPYYQTNDSQIDNEFSKFEDELRAEQDSNREEFWKLLNESQARQDKELLLEQKSREFDKALLYGNQYSAAQQEKALDALDALAGENRLANEFLGLQSAIPTTQDSFLGGRGAVPTGETSPIRGYNGHTGDTRGVQENWWDGTDMGQGMNYMDQFPQIDGSDNSMREYMMGRKDMSGTIYDPTPSNFVPNAILDKPYNPPTPQTEQTQNYTPWQSLMDIGSGAKDALSEGYEIFRDNVQDYRKDRSFPSQSIPSLPSIFDATEYVTDNLAGPVDNFLSGSFQGMSDNYANVADSVSGMWGDLTDWMSGGKSDESKAAEAEEKERKDAYVEEVRKRYEAAGFDFDYSSRKHAERQYEKDKAQGLL